VKSVLICFRCYSGSAKQAGR